MKTSLCLILAFTTLNFLIQFLSSKNYPKAIVVSFHQTIGILAYAITTVASADDAIYFAFVLVMVLYMAKLLMMWERN